MELSNPQRCLLSSIVTGLIQSHVPKEAIEYYIDCHMRLFSSLFPFIIFTRWSFADLKWTLWTDAWIVYAIQNGMNVSVTFTLYDPADTFEITRVLSMLVYRDTTSWLWCNRVLPANIFASSDSNVASLWPTRLSSLVTILSVSYAHGPPTDVATAIINRVLEEMVLSCMNYQQYAWWQYCVLCKTKYPYFVWIVGKSTRRIPHASSCVYKAHELVHELKTIGNRMNGCLESDRHVLLLSHGRSSIRNIEDTNSKEVMTFGYMQQVVLT